MAIIVLLFIIDILYITYVLLFSLYVASVIVVLVTRSPVGQHSELVKTRSKAGRAVDSGQGIPRDAGYH